jgi:hypothetical protein
MNAVQPDASRLIREIGYKLPLLGFYDAPDPSAFEPIVAPEPGECIFDFYQKWISGKTLHITKDHYGCGGAGNYFCGLQTRSEEAFIKFLYEGEGLKASRELMLDFVNSRRKYKMEHENVMIGPLKPDQYRYLKTITFFVNPDQLGVLMTGAQYNAKLDGPPPVIAPFGSGCSLLIPFDDLNVPQGSIGGTDSAMRENFPPDILAFTVTKPLFEELCALDERSFLYKSFWQGLKKARGIAV